MKLVPTIIFASLAGLLSTGCSIISVDFKEQSTGPDIARFTPQGSDGTVSDLVSKVGWPTYRLRGTTEKGEIWVYEQVDVHHNTGGLCPLVFVADEWHEHNRLCVCVDDAINLPTAKYTVIHASLRDTAKCNAADRRTIEGNCPAENPSCQHTAGSMSQTPTTTGSTGN